MLLTHHKTFQPCLKKPFHKFTSDIDAIADKGFTNKTNNLTIDRNKSNIPLQAECHTYWRLRQLHANSALSSAYSGAPMNVEPIHNPRPLCRISSLKPFEFLNTDDRRTRIIKVTIINIVASKTPWV